MHFIITKWLYKKQLKALNKEERLLLIARTAVYLDNEVLNKRLLTDIHYRELSEDYLFKVFDLLINKK